MKILCVCAQGLNRSRYCAEYLAQRGHDTRYHGSEEDAPNPLSQEDIDWAESIIYAKERHQKLVHNRFLVENKQEYALGVSDRAEDIPPAYRVLRTTHPKEFYEGYTFPRLKAAIEKLPLDS